jgi:hypothetical protein
MYFYIRQIRQKRIFNFHFFIRPIRLSGQKKFSARRDSTLLTVYFNIQIVNHIPAKSRRFVFSPNIYLG